MTAGLRHLAIHHHDCRAKTPLAIHIHYHDCRVKTPLANHYHDCRVKTPLAIHYHDCRVKTPLAIHYHDCRALTPMATSPSLLDHSVSTLVITPPPFPPPTHTTTQQTFIQAEQNNAHIFSRHLHSQLNLAMNLLLIDAVLSGVFLFPEGAQPDFVRGKFHKQHCAVHVKIRLQDSLGTSEVTPWK